MAFKMFETLRDASAWGCARRRDGTETRNDERHAGDVPTSRAQTSGCSRPVNIRGNAMGQDRAELARPDSGTSSGSEGRCGVHGELSAMTCSIPGWV